MYVCPYVRASLEDGESDLGRISLAHAEFIQVKSQTAVVFLTSPTTTPFPADRKSKWFQPIANPINGILETAIERDITMNENSVWLLLNGKNTYTTAN